MDVVEQQVSITPVVNIIRCTELQRGDILVLTTDKFLAERDIKCLEAQIQTVLPAGVKVAVFDGGLKIDGIIRG